MNVSKIDKKINIHSEVKLTQDGTKTSSPPTVSWVSSVLVAEKKIRYGRAHTQTITMNDGWFYCCQFAWVLKFLKYVAIWGTFILIDFLIYN